jgi:hypothetical protein
MNGNFYSNEQLSNIRHAELLAEADVYRMVKQAEQRNTSEALMHPITFRPFGWLRQLVLRLGAARA